jgi:hypothetical protein
MFVVSVCLFPVLSGILTSGYTIALVGGILLALFFPALLGALVCEGWRELSPGRLKEALTCSPNYMKTALASGACLLLALGAVWLVDGSAIWRSPVAVLGMSVGGALIGLMRRDAETLVSSD